MRIIAGTHKGKRLHSPKGMDVRPTSSRLREALFNILQNEIEGATFLDLFAGSGAVGLEAISRGAKHATFVEESRESAMAIKKNIGILQAEEATTVISEDALRALSLFKRRKKSFDIIFVDPPYGQEDEAAPISLRVLKAIDSMSLLAKGGLLFIEESKKISLAEVPLETLTLKNWRTSGKSALYQFQADPL